MKNILVFLFSLIAFLGYSQTVLDPAHGATSGFINIALQEAIPLNGTDTYTATKAGVSYTTGYAYDFTFGNANTGTSPTINLNPGSGALGAISVRKYSAGSLISVAANDLKGTMRLRYDGTFFVLDGIGNITSGASGAASGDLSGTYPAPTVSKILNNTVPANASGVLTNNGSGTLTWGSTGVGSVTNVSSADGNATVATGTSTPVITIVSAPKLQTGRTIGITGDITYTSPSFDGSGNVTAASTYNGTVPVTKGGTNQTSLTAFAPLFGGTTSTGSVQSGTVGTSGQVLTSNGAGVLPTFQPAASGFSNPMTTLGDLMYENATPAAARLAGNATATKQFLTQTGNGSISATPVWSAIVAGDVPTLNQNTTGNAATVTTIPTLSGDVTNSGNAVTVTKINSTSLAGLTTGILKNTTGTGVPSIAVAGDFPTLNQNTTGNAGTSTALATGRTIGTLTGDATSAGSSFDGTGNNTNALTLANTAVTPGSYTNTNLTVDSKGRITSAANGSGGANTILTPTAEKTANYTAVAGDLVLCDATSSAFTITLPTAPSDLTRIGVKIVKPASAATFTITVALGGSDHINRTTGPTSTTLTRLGRTINFQYKSSTAVWYVTESDEALERSVRKFFNVEYYGAVHDGQTTQRTTNDGTMNGTTAVLTSAAGAVFTASDVGKVIVVSGAGAAGIPLRTTILSFQNSGQVTLSTNSATAVTTANIVWGTDDTNAIQATLNAAFAAKGGTVYAPEGIYIINGALQTSVGGQNPNSQIIVPMETTAYLDRVGITILGDLPNSISDFQTNITWNGTIFYSTDTNVSGSIKGILGGIGPTGSAQTFGYTTTLLKNFELRAYTNNGAHAPYISGFYGKFFGVVSTDNASATIDVPTFSSATALGSNTYGMYMSSILNLGPITIKGGTAQGYETGWAIGEHALLLHPYAFGNYNGYFLQATSFDISGKILAHHCNTQIVFENATKNVPINLTLEVENDATGHWTDSQNLFADPGNKATGVLSFTDVALSSLRSTYTGGANLYLKPIDQYIAQHSNTAGAYVNSTGSSGVSNTQADFQISTGQAATTTTKFAVLSLVTSQANTAGAGGVFQVLNSAVGTGASNRILMADETDTNGATNTGINYRGLSVAGVFTNVWQLTTSRFSIAPNFYIGNATTSPTAKLHIAAGSTVASTAPIKFTAGSAMTTPETGAIEYDGTNFAITTGTGASLVRKTAMGSQVTRLTAQTAAIASLTTFTVGASDASFMVSARVLITTATTHSFNVTCAYTDESNTARTLTLNFSTLAGVISNSPITNVGGTVPYEGSSAHIRCKAATTITIATTGTFTAVVYNAEGMIIPIN